MILLMQRQNFLNYLRAENQHNEGMVYVIITHYREYPTPGKTNHDLIREMYSRGEHFNLHQCFSG